MAKTHTQIINLWPSREDLSKAMKVKIHAVYKWHYRNSIPAEYWVDLIKASKKIGVEITLDQLAQAVRRK